MVALAMLKTFGMGAADRALHRAAQARQTGDYDTADQWQRIAKIIQYEQRLADEGEETFEARASAWFVQRLRDGFAGLGCRARLHLLLARPRGLAWPSLPKAVRPRAFLEALTGYNLTVAPVFQQAVDGGQA